MKVLFGWVLLQTAITRGAFCPLAHLMNARSSLRRESSDQFEILAQRILHTSLDSFCSGVAVCRKTIGLSNQRPFNLPRRHATPLRLRFSALERTCAQKRGAWVALFARRRNGLRLSRLMVCVPKDTRDPFGPKTPNCLPIWWR